MSPAEDVQSNNRGTCFKQLETKGSSCNEPGHPTVTQDGQTDVRPGSFLASDNGVVAASDMSNNWDRIYIYIDDEWPVFVVG